MAFSEQELNRIYVGGFMNRSTNAYRSGADRWLEHDQIVTFTAIRSTYANANFKIEGTNQEIWYSQLAEIFFDAYGELKPATIKLKDGTSKYICEYEVHEFESLIKNRKFRVDLTGKFLKINKNNPSFGSNTTLGDIIDRIKQLLQERNFEEAKPLYQVGPCYNLIEV